MKPRPTARRRAAAGFTLAEVAVALVISAMTLMLVMQGVVGAKLTAAQTSYRKIARDLAQLAIGWVESGLFWDDLDGLPGTLYGDFAEEGYDAFRWEIIVGEDTRSAYEDSESGYFDSLAYERYRRREALDEDPDREPYPETGSTGGPYEVVTVRVFFPQLTDQPNTLEMTRWVPLDQVFGQGEDNRYAPDEDDAERDD